MKKAFLFVALSGFIAMFISCAAVNEKTLKESGAKLLSQQDLIEFYKVERAGTVKTSRGSLKIHYFPDRTQKMTWPGGSDEGTYRIENGEMCVKWKIARDGVEKCTRVYNIEENKYEVVYIDGSHAGSITFEK